MLSHLRPALSMIFLFTALLGLGYPLAMTGISKAAFPQQAGGSLISLNGKAVGSALIGQAFASERYFHGRPSATADTPYNGGASTGTNLGPTSAKLRNMIAKEIDALHARGISGALPADAVTNSGSGLDPDISPAYAGAQVRGVAKARGASENDVAALVDANTEKPVLGFIGEPRINVLRINMALDKVLPPK